jgi:glycosyltransferase involved in cell wall biosynthesis
MPVKRYGIYVAYPPTVDMGHEGLGRYLAAFLKGAAQRKDVRFVLVCPSWSRKSLDALLAAEHVPKGHFEIRHPEKMPIMLRAYEAISAYRKRLRERSRWQRLVASLRKLEGRAEQFALRRLAGALTIGALVPLALGALLLVVMLLLLTPLLIVAAIGYLLLRGARLAMRWLRVPLAHANNRLQRVLMHPEDDSFVFRLYKLMEDAESQRMLKLIEGMPDVRAWYCPTAFWPAFHQIRAPKLMCVPDVVLRDFATDFSQIGGDRVLTTFEEVETAIRSATKFVTYSDAIKWETLVDGYAVDSADVTVVQHAPNDLSSLVAVDGFSDKEATSRRYCEVLLGNALRRSTNPSYSNNLINHSIKFLFYASQFRPNKNVISLLRAYEYLLRTRRIPHKLILTGKPSALPAVQQFICENFLENDVLCVHGLSLQELAACYKLADLAVNPSLSEGGCPFTFAEALSVGTPVVMARIPVTEEVLTDADLQEKMLFDPYDLKDIARRIEWALEHREELLAIQKKVYEGLAKRNWVDVVNEHIEVLDHISS